MNHKRTNKSARKTYSIRLKPEAADYIDYLIAEYGIESKGQAVEFCLQHTVDSLKRDGVTRIDRIWIAQSDQDRAA